MAEPVTATPGQAVNAVLLPKILGILPFNQANRGAQEAAKELGSTGTLEFIGPTPENSAAGQIKMLTNATTQKQNVVMLSNNAGDQVAPAAEAAAASGTRVVTWDSPIPNGAGESFFVAQVDCDSIGTVMADMAFDLAGGAGEFAVPSASPDAANQSAWIDAMKKVLAEDAKYKDLNLPSANAFSLGDLEIRVTVLLALAAVLVTGLALTFYRPARRFYAVGSNPDAAVMVGINAKRVVLTAFILSGAFAGLSGFLFLAKSGNITVVAGLGYEIKSIAAVVVGGVSIMGGSGSMIGVLTGALLVDTIDNSLTR